jgi:hypothetical protein
MAQDLAICPLAQIKGSKTTTTLVLAWRSRPPIGTSLTNRTLSSVPQPRRKMG